MMQESPRRSPLCPCATHGERPPLRRSAVRLRGSGTLLHAWASRASNHSPSPRSTKPCLEMPAAVRRRVGFPGAARSRVTTANNSSRFGQTLIGGRLKHHPPSRSRYRRLPRNNPFGPRSGTTYWARMSIPPRFGHAFEGGSPAPVPAPV